MEIPVFASVCASILQSKFILNITLLKSLSGNGRSISWSNTWEMVAPEWKCFIRVESVESEY